MTYLLSLDQKPGGNASLDEFAAERFARWSNASERAKEVQAILGQRYPRQRVFVCAEYVNASRARSTARDAALQRKRSACHAHATARLIAYDDRMVDGKLDGGA